jgi:titin
VATALSVSQIQLTWVDRADNELGYAIEHSTNGTTFSQVATVAANTTTYTASGLSAGTKYYYRVRGWAGLGYSGYSATASATTLVFVPAPSNLQAAALSESQLRLTWIDNAGNEGGFKIERSTDGGTTFSQIATTAANLTSYNVTGLSVNTSYTFRVRAYGAGADSAYSNTASATTLTISAPSNLAATAVSSTRVNLTWSDNSGSEQGFFIDWSTDQVTWVRTVQMVPNLTTYGITILSPGTSYYFRVQANASSGNSTYSNVANATTYAVNAPTGLAVSVVSANQINLTWRDNANNESAYSIERSTNGTTFAVIGTVAVNLTTYSSTGLAVGVLYYYRVRATTTGGGFSAYSNTVSARTSAATPNAPSNLQATGTSETQISLSWTDNASNEAGFKIERSTDGGTTFVQVATLPANTTSYNVTGLSANTGYMFRVRAYAAGGDSAYSNTATGATPVANAPTNAAASVVSSSQVKVTWTDNSSTEVGFFIDRSVDQVTWMRTVQMTPNLTMYTVTGLATNTTYYFRVQALAGGGPSPYSNIASARTPIAGAVPGGSASPSSLASQTLASGTSPSLLSQADQGQLLM